MMMKKFYKEGPMEYKTMRDKSVVLDDEGKIIAEVDYPPAGENCVHMKRTFVSGAVREHGLASRLLNEAALYLRKEG